LLIITAAVFMLSACGNRTPLQLPKPVAKPATAPAAPATPPADNQAK